MSRVLRASELDSCLTRVEFVDEYFAHYSATRRPGSVIRHRTSWNAVAPVLGDKRLDEITPLDLERYRRKRKQAGKSDVSINRELGFLRHVFNRAIDWDKAVENPVKKIRFAREDNGRVRFLSADEETRLLAHCSDPLRPIIIIALHTGLRRSELLALTWDDVDFERGLITVRAAYAKNGERRSVPMNTMLTRTLETVRIKARGIVFRKKEGGRTEIFVRHLSELLRKLTSLISPSMIYGTHLRAVWS